MVATERISGTDGLIGEVPEVGAQRNRPEWTDTSNTTASSTQSSRQHLSLRITLPPGHTTAYCARARVRTRVQRKPCSAHRIAALSGAYPARIAPQEDQSWHPPPQAGAPESLAESYACAPVVEGISHSLLEGDLRFPAGDRPKLRAVADQHWHIGGPQPQRIGFDLDVLSCGN